MYQAVDSVKLSPEVIDVLLFIFLGLECLRTTHPTKYGSFICSNLPTIHALTYGPTPMCSTGQ